MAEEIKKAIIPAGGLGTRFLPLTKILAKESLPLVDRPLIDYAVSEAVNSDISEITFVFSKEKEAILNYFKQDLNLEGLLKKREEEEILKELKKDEEKFKNIEFFSSFQEKPKGDGDAVLKTEKFIKGEPAAVLFPDDIFPFSKIPVIRQLANVFYTSQRPIIGLKRVEKERISAYGIVEVQKIAHRLYKIKEIIEKPKDISKTPSDLAIAWRYIINSEVFEALKETPANKKGEIILAEGLRKMLNDGRIIYGYEIEGEWLECGDKLKWLISNFHLCLAHPIYGPILKDFLKK